MLHLSKNRSNIFFSFGLLLVALSLFCPHLVLAQGSGSGGGLTGFEQNIKKSWYKHVLDILQVCATVAGVGFILTSLFKFDQHKKNPTQIPMGQPLTLLIIGACLLVLPFIVKTLTSSVDPSNQGGQLSSQLGGGSGSGSGG